MDFLKPHQGGVLIYGVGDLKGHIINLIPIAEARDISRDQKMVGKFVIISHYNQLILICGLLKEYPYHANLVDRYCADNEVASSWTKRPDLHEVFDSDCVVEGGGWIEVDRISRQVKLFGESTVYGACRRGDLNHLFTSDPTFAGYTVTSI